MGSRFFRKNSHLQKRGQKTGTKTTTCCLGIFSCGFIPEVTPKDRFIYFKKFGQYFYAEKYECELSTGAKNFPSPLKFGTGAVNFSMLGIQFVALWHLHKFLLLLWNVVVPARLEFYGNRKIDKIK